MDKRFLAWLALSLAVFVLYAQFFLPKPPKLNLKKPGEVAQDEDEANADIALGDAALRDTTPVEDPRVPEVTDDEDEVGPPPQADEEPPQQDSPVQFVSLGSVETNSPYRMLVTLTNEGAAVRRLEMSSLRFRDLQDRSGYLGHLEAVDAEGGGAEVQIIGAGTPAAKAGILLGDIITAVGETEINAAEELTVALAKTKPKQQVLIKVRRASGSNEELTTALIRRPLEVMRPEIENLMAREEKPMAGFVDPASFLFSISKFGNRALKEDQLELPGSAFRTGRWRITDQTESSVTFCRRAPKLGLEVLKKYTLADVPENKRANRDYPAYHLTLEITVRNTSSESCKFAYSLDGATGMPTEGWWYGNRINRGSGVAGLRDVVAHFDGESPVQISASEITEEGNGSLKGSAIGYIGVDSQYFSTVFLPNKPSLDTQWFDRAETIRVDPMVEAKKRKPIFTNVTCRLHRKQIELKPAEEMRDRYDVFCGPKRASLLAEYRSCDNPEYSLSDLIYYGWPIWGKVARIMAGILHMFYAVVGNYGVAIIMLTVVVRLCMFPLSRKQALNMAKMQELKPEMDRINEKYKKDMEKRTKAQQELWKNNNYNPMGGCLLAFVQLPIFFGLYRSLMIDVELRQAPLLSESIRWCSNLSAPDMLFDWSNFMPEFIQGWLGPYFNILPLFTIGLFIMQQKLFMPPAATEQAEMQQKMMKFMMLFMGVLFFKVASGLCIYFIASSLWGIAERKLLPRTMKSSSDPTATTSHDMKSKDTEKKGKKGAAAKRKKK